LRDTGEKKMSEQETYYVIEAKWSGTDWNDTPLRILDGCRHYSSRKEAEQRAKAFSKIKTSPPTQYRVVEVTAKRTAANRMLG
jgi:hypothetical protein